MTADAVPLSGISLTGWNPRKEFPEEELSELQESIREHGILQPLLVRPDGNGGHQLVAGERRYRAALSLGLDSVPVVIRDLSDRETKEIMLIENLQRSELSALEEAVALRDLLEGDGAPTQTELSARIGKSQAWIANRLRFLRAVDDDEDLRELIISREITPTHVLILQSFKEYAVHDRILTEFWDLVADRKLSTRDLEERIEGILTWDYETEFVLNLDDLPYAVDHLEDLLDLSSCESCSHIRTVKRHGGERICLNRPCWKDKVNLAQQRYEREILNREPDVRVRDEEEEDDQQYDQGDHQEKARGEDDSDPDRPGRITTKGLHYDEYTRMSSHDFDVSCCRGCGNLVLDADWNDREVCLDPACYRKHKAAATRKRNKERREETSRLLTRMHDDLVYGKESLNANAVTAAMKRLVYHGRVHDNRPLERYLDEQERKVHQPVVPGIVDRVPDDELEQVLLELLIWHELPDSEYRTPTAEDLDAAVEKILGVE